MVYSAVPVVLGWPALTVSFCVWLFNISRSISTYSGYYLLQGSLLRLAWVYPAFSAPLCMGCVSLAMAYNEV